MSNRANQYEEVVLILAPETELVAVDPLVDELRQDFLTITIKRTTFGVAAGGPGFEYLEIGLIVVLGMSAFEFLKAFVSEAGRDAYQMAKAALVRTYRMLPVQTDRGKFHPLAFQLELDNPPRRLTYRFRDQMMTGQMATALQLMVADALSRREDEELVFDAELMHWIPLQRLTPR